MSVSHKAGIGDHYRIQAVFRINVGQSNHPRHKKQNYWKLNTSLLKDPHFHCQFVDLYKRLTELVEEYEDHAEWWEAIVKPSIDAFCQDFCIKMAEERRATKEFIYASINISIKEANWVCVAKLKEKLRKIFSYEAFETIIRSREK